jgi:hypothetical protein
MIDARALIGTHDIVLLTFDSLRYDVAADALARGRTPNLAALLPSGQWELRHTPGTFTFAAHQAFFAGFLPTPVAPDRTGEARLFALRFAGSRSTGPGTALFDADNIVKGLAEAGYHTLCVGGVGFFNKQNALSSVLPGMFAESHWHARMGVTHPASARHQVDCAVKALNAQPRDQRVFLFVNFAATHPPTHIYIKGEERDSSQSQMAALISIDHEIGRLVAALRQRAPCLLIMCSDHGTTFGEEGFHGHRLAHRNVLEVPYCERILP